MIESLVSGGIVGLLGSVVSNVTAYFKGKQEHKNSVEIKKLDLIAQERMQKHSIALIQAEAAYRREQLVIESERDIGVAEYAAIAASHNAERSYDGDNSLLRFAEFARRITRPMLTFLLVILTAMIYFSAADAELADLVARAVVAMTATVVSWWFADRQIAKQIAGRVL